MKKDEVFAKITGEGGLTHNEKERAMNRLTTNIASVKRDFCGDFTDADVVRCLGEYYAELKAEGFKKILAKEFGRSLHEFLYAFISFERELSAKKLIKDEEKKAAPKKAK